MEYMILGMAPPQCGRNADFGLEQRRDQVKQHCYAVIIAGNVAGSVALGSNGEERQRFERLSGAASCASKLYVKA